MIDDASQAVAVFPDEFSLTGNISDFRVMVVDDSYHMRKVLHGLFNLLGVRQVRTADSAESACENLKLWQPHLVVTDLRMRPMSGLDLIKAIRTSTDTRHPDLPIIVVTGFADLNTVQYVKSAGAIGVLVKPVSLDALREHVTPLITAAQCAAASLKVS